MKINAKITQPNFLFVKAKSNLMAEIQKEMEIQAKLLESGAKTNASNQQIKDSGGLINSIKAVVYDLRVIVGTTKVYGRMHEEGGKITEKQIKAMFASLSERSSKSRDQEGGKGVVDVDALTWKPRPYLIPAFNERVEDMNKRMDVIIKNANG